MAAKFEEDTNDFETKKEFWTRVKFEKDFSVTE
jgi:hypothetical protein